MFSSGRLAELNKSSILLAIGLLFIFIWFLGFRQGLLWLIGIGFGVCLNGAKFGFTSGWRNLIKQRQSEGCKAQLFLLALLIPLTFTVMQIFPHLQAATAPISLSMIGGAVVFGACMQLADGCGSGTLYKAGNMQAYNLIILPFFILGAFSGSLHLDWWLSLGGVLPPTNLMNDLPSWYYLLMQFAILAVLWLICSIVSRRSHLSLAEILASTVSSLKSFRITFYAALGLCLLAVANLLVAGQPWGIVYGLGLWGAKVAQAIGMELSNYAYWRAEYNQFALTHSVLFDNTSMTNLGLLFGAFCVRDKGNHSQLNQSESNSKYWRLGKIALIGLVLGYASRLAFGCNIGAFVSGVSTGSLHGWVWLLAAFTGSWLILKSPFINNINK